MYKIFSVENVTKGLVMFSVFSHFFFSKDFQSIIEGIFLFSANLKEVHEQQNYAVTDRFKGPCSLKRHCTLVKLFRNSSSILIG